MSIYAIHFSPTQSTRRIAEVLLADWGAYSEIDLCQPVQQRVFTPEDICLVGVPSYGGRVPNPVAERLQGLTGNGAQAVLLVSYGNRHYDDTLMELFDLLRDRGFLCIAAVAAVAEHSIMHQFAAGRPDERDIAELKQFSQKIRQKQMAAVAAQVQVPGNRPYKEFKGVPIKPQVTEDCQKCGLCAKLCPTGAISTEHPEQTDAARCITCMRCIQICPHKARMLEKTVLEQMTKRLEAELQGRKENRLFLG